MTLKDRKMDIMLWLEVLLPLLSAKASLQLLLASSLSPVIAEELFRCDLTADKEIFSRRCNSDMTKLKKTIVVIDNSLSPAHTLLQIHCVDQKGLLYDVMRTLKDCNIKIAYGRFSPSNKDCRGLDESISRVESDDCKVAPYESISLPELSHKGIHYFRKKLKKHMYTLSVASDKYGISYL